MSKVKRRASFVVMSYFLSPIKLVHFKRCMYIFGMLFEWLGKDKDVGYVFTAVLVLPFINTPSLPLLLHLQIWRRCFHFIFILTCISLPFTDLV